MVWGSYNFNIQVRLQGGHQVVRNGQGWFQLKFKGSTWHFKVDFTPHNSKVKGHLKFTELDINASQACISCCWFWISSCSSGVCLFIFWTCSLICSLHWINLIRQQETFPLRWMPVSQILTQNSTKQSYTVKAILILPNASTFSIQSRPLEKIVLI